jgi:hypothetical protein
MLLFILLKNKKSTSTRQSNLIGKLNELIEGQKGIVVKNLSLFHILSDPYNFLNIAREANFKFFNLRLIAGRDKI